MLQLYNLVFFCSILAQDFSCAMSGKFVQRCCGIYSKTTERWCYSEEIALSFFLCTVFWSLLGNIKQGFYLCNVVPRVLRQHWTSFFQCNVVWSCMDNMAQGFFSYFVQCCPKRIKTTLKKVFLVQCCLQNQGQHYIGFSCGILSQKD